MLIVLPFLAWPYLITNLILALIQGIVPLRRYEQTTWALLSRQQAGYEHP